MTTRQLEGHIRYVLSMQTHKLHEARKACKVYTKSFRDTPTREQLLMWRRQMSEADLGSGPRNLAAAVANLYATEEQTQRWANRSMKPLMDWTKAPQGLLRPNDN